MKNKMMQHVFIKGRKSGLTFYLDDLSSLEEIRHDIQEIILNQAPLMQQTEAVQIKVHSGNRIFVDEQLAELQKLLESSGHFVVKAFESSVIVREKKPAKKIQENIQRVEKVVRSGQILEITGDILLIGDVNSGGIIKATGSIYIVGRLYGSAFAGSKGDKKTIIAASELRPIALAIGDYHLENIKDEGYGLNQFAYVNDDMGMIVVDSVKQLHMNQLQHA